MATTRHLTALKILTALAAAALCARLAGPAIADEIDCAAPRCDTRLTAACLERLSAGAIDAEAEGGTGGGSCVDQQADYVACLRAVAEQCGASAPAQSGIGPGGPDAFIGEWEFGRMVERRDDRIDCIYGIRIERTGRIYRYGWRAQNQSAFEDSRWIGRYVDGALQFDNGVTFRLSDEGLVFDSERAVCAFLRAP